MPAAIVKPFVMQCPHLALFIARRNSGFKMPPVIRTNSDYLFILGTQNDRVIKALWDEFGGLGFDDWKAFRSHAAAAVKDFGSLVLDTHDAKHPVRCVRAPGKPAEFQLRQ